MAAGIEASASPQEVVILEPIGMIGYETMLPVIDEVGLVSPDVVRRRLLGSGSYADLVSSREPTWLVVRRELLADPSGFAGAGSPFRSSAERERVLSEYRLTWPDRQLEGIVLMVSRRNSWTGPEALHAGSAHALRRRLRTPLFDVAGV